MTTKSHHEKHPLSLVSTSSAGTTITVSAVSPTIIPVNFNTMSGNQPSSYGNTLFIWQNQSVIPYNQQPLSSQAVTKNSQAGGANFSGLQVQTISYIIGYAVGPSVTNICSWVYVPAAGTEFPNYQTSVSVPQGGVTPDSVLVAYDTPAGNQPQTNGQWVGIWQGQVAFYTLPPLAQVAISNNNSTSQVPLPVTLLRGTTYTLGYFMGQKQTTLAASYTFTT